jgi:uncharacterized RDD family membrane protein YckC
MKCPKCHYISFDEVERCRNCGYDFTLSRNERPTPELPLRHEAPAEGPARDFPLSPSLTIAPTPAPDARRPERVEPTNLTPVVDLPLFDEAIPGVDDTPLLTTPAPPRSPLSVRRAAPDPPRVTPAPAPPPVRAGAAVEESLENRPRPSGRQLDVREAPKPDLRDVDSETPAPVEEQAEPSVAGRRLVAAVIDAVIIGAIDLGVLSFTLRLTGLDMEHMTALPLIPFAAFLMLLNGGYLVGFTTASGQTIGKMLTGVRVIGEHTRRVPLGNAIVRAAGVLLTLLSLGLGYLPSFFGRDRCALHDRLAGTRVVRK